MVGIAEQTRKLRCDISGPLEPRAQWCAKPLAPFPGRFSLEVAWMGCDVARGVSGRTV